jgi:hypothetical protein
MQVDRYKHVLFTPNWKTLQRPETEIRSLCDPLIEGAILKKSQFEKCRRREN